MLGVGTEDENSLAARIMSLFEGYSEAHGMYSASAATANDMKGGKLEIKATARTVRAPVTLELWEQHLSGDQPLGIIPIRDNNTCLWGSIDIDEYDISFADMVRLVEKEKLPIVPCRTKSGGVHLFLFMAEPVPAELMRVRLKEIAALIGHGTAEIFPKQSAMQLERGDLGNWLNMPYFGGDETDRYGLKAGGTAMSLAEFVNRAESIRQPRLFLSQSFRKSRETVSENGRPPKDPNFGDGPPCMQHLTTVGFPEGTRNKGLFALATFAKKKYGQRWQEVLEDWNRQFFSPPLPSSEVLQIIKSQDRKEYHYTCKEHPLSAHCNSTLCRTRKFGVGGEDDYPIVSGLSVLKSNPPLWFVDVDEKRLELTTEQLQNYTQFHRICMEQLFICYKMMKSHDWLTIVANAMRDAVEIEVPPEVGFYGQFEELLEDFVLNKHRGETREDLLVGRPFEDTDEKRHYFRLKDLMRFLELAGFKVYNRAQVTTRLKALNGDRGFFNLKGKGVNVWWIPSVFVPTPTLSLPHIEKEPI